jgi:hypothetical protein
MQPVKEPSWRDALSLPGPVGAPHTTLPPRHVVTSDPLVTSDNIMIVPKTACETVSQTAAFTMKAAALRVLSESAARSSSLLGCIQVLRESRNTHLQCGEAH